MPNDIKNKILIDLIANPVISNNPNEGKTAAMHRQIKKNPQMIEAWKNIDWIAANAPVSYDQFLKGDSNEKE